MSMTFSAKFFPFFSSKHKNPLWFVNHLKIIRALNKGNKTNHEIHLFTGLSYYCISKHRKEIIECPICHNYQDKNIFCVYCGFRLVESYG